MPGQHDHPSSSYTRLFRNPYRQIMWVIDSISIIAMAALIAGGAGSRVGFAAAATGVGLLIGNSPPARRWDQTNAPVGGGSLESSQDGS